jgi:hypothetical protein
MFYIFGHMLYVLVYVIDFLGILVEAAKKFHEETGATEVASKLEWATSAIQAIRNDSHPTTYLELQPSILVAKFGQLLVDRLKSPTTYSAIDDCQTIGGAPEEVFNIFLNTPHGLHNGFTTFFVFHCYIVHNNDQYMANPVLQLFDHLLDS